MTCKPFLINRKGISKDYMEILSSQDEKKDELKQKSIQDVMSIFLHCLVQNQKF